MPTGRSRSRFAKNPGSFSRLRINWPWLSDIFTVRRHAPGLNPIKMAFSKLKALIRKQASRSFGQLWANVEQIYVRFTEEKCCDHFKPARLEAIDTK